MKINRLLTVVLLAAILAPAGIEATASSRQPQKREYNCRMPRRDSGRHDRCPEGSVDCGYLFGNLGLSHYQRSRLEKAYSKYQKEMRKLDSKMRGGSRRDAEKYRREAMRIEDKFLHEAGKVLGRGKYHEFERRFRSGACGAYRHHGNSAPRPGEPGNGVGPVVKGPSPRLMTEGQAYPD